MYLALTESSTPPSLVIAVLLPTHRLCQLLNFIFTLLASDVVILGFMSAFIMAFEVIFLHNRYCFVTDQT